MIKFTSYFTYFLLMTPDPVTVLRFTLIYSDFY